MIALFIAQVALYAFVPFYLTLLRNPLRVAGFYVYLGILLVMGSLLGSIYSLPISPSINISGGNLAYGALLMNTVLLVIIERDIASVRRVIQLVIAVSIFTLVLFSLLSLILNNESIIRPYEAAAGIFVLSLPITIFGGTLTIAELLVLLALFEQIKRRITNLTLVSVLYTLSFATVLCLDGLLFPRIAYAFNPQLVAIVIGGVGSKLVMAVAFSIPMLIYLLVFRRTLTEFVEMPLTLAEMLRAPRERLVEEIQRQRQSLALGEEQLLLYAKRLALATESAGLGIWDLDLKTNTLVWDERSFEMYGVAPSDENVTFATWKARVHPDDLAATLAEYEAALAGFRDYHTQFRVVRPDGQIRYVEAHATVQRAADGSPTRMIGVNWDITQRKELAMENEQLTMQFYQAQRLESIGRLAGGIAHDFNNLLVPISSFAELGQIKTETGSSPHTYFKRIKEAADRAAGLIRQILAFGRKQSMEMKATNLNEIVLGFQYMVQRLIGENVELKVELTPEPLIIMADPGQMEQVLMNLIVNARDAMPNGGTLTIATAITTARATTSDSATTNAAADDRVVAAGGDADTWFMVLQVSDTGIGMNEVTKQRIFEPFFTTKPLGEGTGLGLSTVFGIVKQHQGNIEIDSEPGQGAAFKIYLPATQPQPQESQIAPVSES